MKRTIMRQCIFRLLKGKNCWQLLQASAKFLEAPLLFCEAKMYVIVRFNHLFLSRRSGTIILIGSMLSAQNQLGDSKRKIDGN